MLPRHPATTPCTAAMDSPKAALLFALAPDSCVWTCACVWLMFTPCSHVLSHQPPPLAVPLPYSRFCTRCVSLEGGCSCYSPVSCMVCMAIVCHPFTYNNPSLCVPRSPACLPLCSLSGFWFEHAHFVPSDHVSLHTTHWTLADQVVDSWCAIRWCCTLTVQASDRCTHNLSVFLACPFYTIQPTMPPRTATCGSMGACSMLLYLMSTYCTRTCIPQPAVTDPGGCEPCCVPVTLAAIGQEGLTPHSPSS